MHSVHTVNQILDRSKSSGHFSYNQGIQTGHCLQVMMGNLTKPALDILVTNFKTACQHAAPYFGTCYVCGIFVYLDRIVQIGLIISKVHKHIYESLPSTIPPLA